MAKQRYVVRLHRIIRQELDLKARKNGHLTSTYISLAIEDMCSQIQPENYEIHPDSEVFRLKRGNRSKGETKANADRQLSIYLSDYAYGRVGEIAGKLQREVDRNITPAFVIRDLLFHWLEKTGDSGRTD